MRLPCCFMLVWNPLGAMSTNVCAYPARPTRTLLFLPLPYLVSSCWSKALQKSVLTELVLISLGMLAADYCVKWIFFLLTVSLLSTGNANAAVFPTEGFLSPGPSWRVTLYWLHSSGMKFQLFYIYCLCLIEGKSWLCSLSRWSFVCLASGYCTWCLHPQLASCAFPWYYIIVFCLGFAMIFSVEQ